MSEEVKIYEDATWGKVGKNIVPSRFYQAFFVEGVWLGDDEGIYYGFRGNKDHSEVAIEPVYPNFESNKYGKAVNYEVINVTITPNATLKKENPLAQVSIDGKFYDLAILDKPIKLYMNKDHRVSILWQPTTLVETFRFVAGGNKPAEDEVI